MKISERRRIAASIFSPMVALRPLADEPLTADDWRKVWEARKNYLAAIRQIVFEAKTRQPEVP